MTSRRGPNSSNRNPPGRPAPEARGDSAEKIEPPPPVPDAEVKLPEEAKPPISPKRNQRRRCPRRRRPRGQGRLPRKSLHGIAELPSRSSDTKAIRLRPRRGTRPAPHNSHLRSIATERSWRAASSGRRVSRHSIRKQSTRCGVRSPSRRRRRTCPVKRSISPCPFDSTFARPKGGQT